MLNSQELLDLLHTTVEKNGFGNGLIDRIEKELVEKSRVFMWYTREEPVKMTGFLPTGLEPTWDDVVLATDGKPGEVSSKIHAKFHEIVTGKDPKYDSWLDYVN